MKPATRTLILPFEAEILPLPPAERPWLFLNATPLDTDWRDRVTAVQGFRPEFLALQRAGHRVNPEIEGTSYPGALILLGRHRGQNEGWLADALEHVEPAGIIVVAGDKTAGIDSFRKRVAAIAPVEDRISKHHAVVFWLRRPADLDPEIVAGLRPAPTLLDGRFTTAPGMFSHASIDRGSAMLAEYLDGRLSGAVADFGAGWGYLAAECLMRSDAIGQLDLYEADHASLEAARRNLVRFNQVRLGFHWTDLIRESIPERYDAIVMNPPFHAGRAADPTLGIGFIKAAHAALKSEGKLLMVANRQLPYEAALRELFGSVEVVEEGSGFKVIEAYKI